MSSFSTTPAEVAATTDDMATKEAGPETDEWDWKTDAENPYNWPASRKWKQVAMLAPTAFLTSFGSSVISPATEQLMEEFDVTLTQSIVPLTVYVIALALGPVVGGPLSETVGRYPVFAILTPLGLLFTLGAGFVRSFTGLCILRFLAGFTLGPSLAVPPGVINEIFLPHSRGLPSVLFVLMPFIGPGMDPVIGGFVTNRMGWRWTQWTMLYFGLVALACIFALGRESYHPVLERRIMKKRGMAVPESPPLAVQLREFLVVALVRPIDMLFTEPIVALSCLYVACEFGTLYSFFAAVPFVFEAVYGLSLEQSGLVFLAIIVGCALGAITCIVCDVLLYRPQIPRHPANMVPPEYRLYPAMVGSTLIPVSLFWFGWTARRDISWASPAVSIVPFAWGNLCIFISLVQFTVDTYHGTTVASAASANSLARYAFAGAFPLFTSQMYTRLGIGWASSLLGFISLALLPVPFLFFKYGKRIRAKSWYKTASY